MADIIKCPVCGEGNAGDQEFCQYCQSRLQPLTGPLKGADAPLHPGQIPTKKVTAELEPILPQWLRDARNKARQSAEVDTSQAMQQQERIIPPNASEPDLLAGLRSQSRGDDDEDTPDWLANITGVSPKQKKIDSGSSEARRVELGDRSDFAGNTGALKESIPAWPGNTQEASSDPEKDELKDWFRESSGIEGKKDDVPASDSAGWSDQPVSEPGSFSNDQFVPAVSSSDSDSPDWLKRMAPEEDPGNVPSWLSSDMQQEAKGESPSSFADPASGTFEAAPSSADDVPNWLQGIDPKATSAEGVSSDDWLKEHQPKPVEPNLNRHTTPMWLKGNDNSATNPAEAETPIWLSDDVPSPPAPPPKRDPFAFDDVVPAFGDIPNWLKAAAPQSSIFADSPAEEAPAAPAEASGWLSTFKSNEPPPTPFSVDKAQENLPPTFTSDAFKDGGENALFTEMPDWLSSASPSAPVSSTPALSDSITPGELPSWVQAMRPVDTTSSAPPASFSSDQTFESRGALSGLQGVLPAVPGYGPSSKPKIYSIKLQASQEQQSHAALLEQILAAEAEPVPITSFSPLRTSRTLRWLISFTVLVLIIGVTSLQTRIFSMPVGIPNEFNGALQVAQNVPESAPILVAVDYHPARVGEMEAAAAPMFDQMMVLRHPRLTFISTNETGAILVEHVLAWALAERGYQYGNQYLNLGYLPGGVMGIRAFTQNPVITMPFDISLNSAWVSSPLQGVTSLSQFAALIVITDNVDTARAWIEQTMSTRQATPFPLVVVSSAQAAPMIQPYYDSGQVTGIVNGLYGGAIFEQNNAGRPGTARSYWDAYSLGLLLAMSLMLGGGLWSLALGLRDRAAAKAGR